MSQQNISPALLEVLGNASSAPIAQQMQAAFTILHETGCRINECLALTHDSLSSGDILFIASSKGSADRYVKVYESAAMIRALTPVNEFGHIFSISYRAIARSIADLGLFIKSPARTNLRLTNAYRSRYIQAKLDEGYTQEEVQAMMGHAKLTSTLSYLE